MGSEDIEQDIIVQCDGTAAVASLDSVSGAMGGIVGSHKELRSAFTERFEHVGVHLFGHDLLHSMGIAQGARPILGLLQASVSGVANAFNFAAGPIGLVTFGLTAFAAIAYRVIEGHHKHGEALDGVIKKSQELHDKNAQLVDKIDAYESAVGRLTPALRDLKTATVDLNAARAGEEVGTLNKAIKAAEEKLKIDDANIAAQRHAAAAAKAVADANKDSKEAQDAYAFAAHSSTEAIKKLNVERDADDQHLKDQKANLAAVQAGFSGYDDQLKRVTETSAKFKKETHDSNAAFTEFTEKTNAKITEMGEGGNQNKWDKKRTEMEEYFREERVQIGKSSTSMEQEASQAVSLYSLRAKIMTAIGAAQARDAKNQLNGVQQAFASTFQSASSEVGRAFADMTVRGKSWHDAFANFAKDMESQFIQMVTQMAIRWAAFMALTGGMGAMSSNSGFASAFSGYTPRHATGADYMVDRPTAFIAGDGGLEHVQVTPAGQAAGGGGSAPQSVSIGVTVNAAGVVSDVRAFANVVGQEVLKQVRGQGQLQFVRGS